MRFRFAAAAVLAVAATASALVPGASPAATTTQVTVMTRNLYLGADLLPLAAAQPGAQFDRAVARTVAHVRATGPTARMRLIAREIAQARPDLVGLQEATVWKTVSHGRTRVVADYLKTIMAELRRLHAPYRIVGERLSLHLTAKTSPGVKVEFTDGNAILARSGVRVGNLRSADFEHKLAIQTKALGSVSVNRSWISLDAVVGGAAVRFVDTHLEAYSTAVRLQQAEELVRGPLKAGGRAILVGDLNSSADLPSAADRPPFLAIRRAGFVDERTPQPNCCFNDDLRTGGWDHVVDHIMARPGVGLVRSFLSGRETTAAGRHPSDHGGVVSVLSLRARVPAFTG
jgi:endonuclease/exonuclease/phosphatase family metal-dependent hydrolase